MKNDRVKIACIISGGQTGADRAALDFALKYQIQSGGYVPKDKMAEDGPIDSKYPNLVETTSDDPAERTRLNVLEADATLICSHGELAGGSGLTAQIAGEAGKPYLHIDVSEVSVIRAAEIITDWLNAVNCRTLNVAGSRASEDPGIYSAVIELMDRLQRSFKLFVP